MAWSSSKARVKRSRTIPKWCARTSAALQPRAETRRRLTGHEPSGFDHTGMPGRYRVGVDIGGTFTDLILVDDQTGELTVGKVLTTPADPSQAVADVLQDALQRGQAPADQVHNVIHGTTLVTNAIIERKGAQTALLTTRGFRDAYEIA